MTPAAPGSGPHPVRVSWDPVRADAAWAVPAGVVVEDWRGDEHATAVEELVHLVDADGRTVGFTAFPLSDLTPGALADDAGSPRFDAPALGLQGATPQEILHAADRRWGTSASDDVAAFHAAVAAAEDDGDLERAASLWARVVDLGDVRGFFGLGYTLLDLGRPHEAYEVLLRYEELTPGNAWSSFYVGRVCERLGVRQQAVSAYRRAVGAQRAGSYATEASERLLALGEPADLGLPEAADSGSVSSAATRVPSYLAPVSMIEAYQSRAMAARRVLVDQAEETGVGLPVLHATTATGDFVLMGLLMLALDPGVLARTGMQSGRGRDDERLLRDGMRSTALADAWAFATYAVAVRAVRDASEAHERDRYRQLIDQLVALHAPSDEGYEAIEAAVSSPHMDIDWVFTDEVLRSLVGSDATRLAVFGTGSRHDRVLLASIWSDGAGVLRAALTATD